MAKAKEIHLTEEEQKILESWVNKGTTEQRMVERAQIILEAAEGKNNHGGCPKLKKASGDGE
jgi:hypothetical protein